MNETLQVHSNAVAFSRDEVELSLSTNTPATTNFPAEALPTVGTLMSPACALSSKLIEIVHRMNDTLLRINDTIEDMALRSESIRGEILELNRKLQSENEDVDSLNRFMNIMAKPKSVMEAHGEKKNGTTSRAS